jgi:hypothetical protein
MTWHLEATTASRYSDRRTDPAIASSVEAHLMACEPCRIMVNDSVPRTELASIWRGIEDVLDVPRLGWLERVMMALGSSDLTARTIGATARSRWAYLLLVAFNVMLAITASRSANPEPMLLAFLFLAPVGPLFATASAFGRWDPVHALQSTLPTSTLHTILVRTAATVVPAVILTAAATPWLAARGWLAVAWLLPALALALTALALSSWIEIEKAAVLVVGAWAGVALVLRFRASQLIDAYVGPLQLACAVAVAAAAITTMARRTEYDYRGF